MRFHIRFFMFSPHRRAALARLIAAHTTASLLAATQVHAQNLLVTSAATDSVKQYRWSDGAYLGDFIAPGSGGLDGPTAIRFGPDGNVYVASQLNSSILRYDGTTGAFLGAFVPALSGGLMWPRAIAFAPNGDLFVASEIVGQECIKRYYAGSGAYAGDFVCLPTMLDVSRSFGLATGPTGDLFVSWTTDAVNGNNIVRRYNSTTGAVLATYFNATLVGPFHGVVATAANVMIANWTGDGIERFNAATTAFMSHMIGDGLPGGTAVDPDGPEDIVIGPNGNLFVVAYASTSSRVQEYNIATGAYVRTFVAPSSGGLSGAVGLAFRPTPPAAADSPFPANGSIDRPLSQDIAWSSANGAASYTVYFGTDSTPDETELLGTQTSNVRDLGLLAPLTTYYWRIDSSNIFGTTPGPVWSFTTRSVDLTGDGIIDMDDLLEVLANWGTGCIAGGPGPGGGCTAATCEGDANGDCLVNIDDLLAIILNFTP